MRDRAVDVDVAREPDRLAVVERLDLRELLRVRFERVGQRPHQPLAPGRADRRPGALGEGRARGRDGAIDVLRAGLRHARDLTAGGGVERRERAPVGGRGSLGADQEALGSGDERARGVSERLGERVRTCGIGGGGHDDSLRIKMGTTG